MIKTMILTAFIDQYSFAESFSARILSVSPGAFLLIGEWSFLAIVPLIIVISLLSLALPLFFVSRLVRDSLQNRRLLQSGEPAAARILKIWDTGVTVNDNPQVGFLLEVRAPDRPVFQAETKSIVSRLQIPLVQAGADVQVRFDRQDPSKVAIVM